MKSTTNLVSSIDQNAPLPQPPPLSNPMSIESMVVASPAGSLEQFDITSTPLSVDEATSDTSLLSIDATTTTSTNSGTTINQLGGGLLSQTPKTTQSSFDPNSPSFRFRRHSSQSSLVNLPLNLNINNSGGSSNNGGGGGPNSGSGTPSTGLISPLTVTAATSAVNGNPERICSVCH